MVLCKIMVAIPQPPRLAEMGSPAPDRTLTDTEGKNVQLSDFWNVQTTVLVFLRHFGCVFCREQVALLRRNYAEFRDLGAEIVCISQGDAKTGKAFSLLFDLPFPLLVTGEDLSVFRDYGLQRGTWRQMFNPHTLGRGLIAMLQGNKQGQIQNDGLQMPGVFIVDTQGILRYTHRHYDAADNPPVRELLQAIQAVVRLSAQ